LSLAKLLYGANVFEISNIQKMKLKPAAKANRNVTMLPWVGNRRMEFSVCTVGPNESEQDSFEGGKVDGDKLTFDALQGPNGEGSIHVEMQVKGDQMTGRATWSGPPPHSGAGEFSLKRVVEK
jgi:hypothetical protein